MNLKFKLFLIYFLGKKNLFFFAYNTSIEELIKIFYCEMNIPENIREYKFYFLFNGQKLNIHNKNTLCEYGFCDGSLIIVLPSSSFSSNVRKGKTFEVLVKIDCKNFDIKKNVGTLEKISEFYEYISYKIIYEVFAGDINIKIITINGKEIKKNDERTFSSLGIRENCICKIETEKKK